MNDIITLFKERREEPRSGATERWHVRIVDSDSPAEVCVTHNVSRCGLYFVTASRLYIPGMRLCVVRNFDPDGNLTTEEVGRVLRVDHLRDNKLGVAVLIQEDEKRVAE
jgi:hypothetical protein